MKILFGRQAREKIKEGVDMCVNAVKVTLGNNGRNVIVYDQAKTDIINDGVSIARKIQSDDHELNAGIMLAKHAASIQNRKAGDGTTTTLVLLQAVLDKVLTEAQIKKPREIRKELQQEAEKVVANLEKNSKKVKGIKDIENVATTASLDPEIGKMIAEIFEELGKNATISLTASSKTGLRKKIEKGIKFSTRNAALYMEDTETFDDVPVIVFDKKATFDELEKKLQILSANGDNEAVVIAPQLDKAAMAMITTLQTKGLMTVAAVENNELNAEDLMAYGNRVKRAIVKRDSTTLIGGNGNIKPYIKKLIDEAEDVESEYDKELLLERISMLDGGIAEIMIGAPTDVETKELQLKIEDAINSARHAYKHGVVMGGGVALMNASTEKLSGICEAPTRQIMENGETDRITGDSLDSLHVIRSAFQTAISVGLSVLTAEAALIDDERREDKEKIYS